jgi:hypothetical protein
MDIVHPRTLLAAIAAALLLLAGCSDPQGTEPGEAAATAADGDASGGTSSGEDGGSGTDGPGAGSGKGGSGGPAGDANGGKPGGGGSGPRGSGGGGPGFAGGPRGSAAYPAAGDYVYAQEGFERFCQGPSCNKQPLPGTATLSASYSERSASEAVVVTEARSSEQQTLTTTTRYTPDEALITRVVIDFSYGGFNFAQTYEPQPPVESLRLPLSAQQGWAGRWKAATSGDYKVRVLGRESVSVGGTSVDAYRLETVTNFRGDFSGRAQLTAWIDPQTKMVVRTDGDIAVASRFGEYTSSFETVLRTGPGY